MVRDGRPRELSLQRALVGGNWRGQRPQPEILPVPSVPAAHTGWHSEVRPLMRTTPRRSVLRRFTVAVLTVALLLVTRRIAQAHTELVSSEPAQNGRLAATPSRVRLVFSEPIEARFGAISLIQSDGGTLKLAVEADPRNVHAMIGRVPSDVSGAIRVVWRVVSADGHPVAGSFVFTVGAVQTSAPPAAPDEHALEGSEPTVAGASILLATIRGLALGVLTVF